MEDLKAFLHPKEKKPITFVLSDRFIGEKDGKPKVWKMRKLSLREGVELQERVEGMSQIRVLLASIAETIVYPDLHSKELLDALGEKEGRRLFRPEEALMALLNDDEMARLLKIYAEYNESNISMESMVDEVKN